MSVKHYDWTAYHAGVRGQEVAIMDLESQTEVTYRQLDDRAAQLACWLQTRGVSKGDRVALLTRNCPEFFEVQFACAKAGAICLPLNWRLTVPELEYILNDSSPSVLVFDQHFAEQSRQLISRCGISHQLEVDPQNDSSEYRAALNATSHQYTVTECTHDDVSMIMYTSGTTGHPKGAMITFGMTFYNTVNLGSPSAMTAEAVQLVILPLFHTGGLNCYANPILHAGGRIVLMREFDPGTALATIGDPDLGVTHFFAVPSPYLFMMQHSDFADTDLSRLKLAGVGGAPCPDVILQGWMGRGVPLIQGWGMTETSPSGTCLPAADVSRKSGSAGKPVLHTEIKIVDEAGKETAPDEVGELLIRGPNVTPGYWNNPEATEKAFTEGWLRTGDAACVDDEGFIYIVDRQKDMYISGGENVYPAEVENVLYQLPQIAAAAVIGLPDERWGETGMAILVLKPHARLNVEEVLDHCLERLAKYKVPSRVEFVDALPRNGTGKVLKRTLKEQFEQKQAHGAESR